MKVYNKKKLIYGKGINDADYAVHTSEKIGGKYKKTWRCPYYAIWCSMLGRCYSNKSLLKRPAYVGVTVCDKWFLFSTFKSWMVEQDWQGKELDKDLLVQGNKVYSPNSCVFIEQALNKLMMDSSRIRGEQPLGVCFDTSRSQFISHISVGYRQTFLGRFTDSLQAHKAWQIAKLRLIKGEIGKHGSIKIDDALFLRCIQLQYDIDNGLETCKL